MDRSRKIIAAMQTLAAGLLITSGVLTYSAGTMTRRAAETLTEAQKARNNSREVYRYGGTVAPTNGATMTTVQWTDNHGVTHVEGNLRSRDAVPRPTEEPRATEVQYHSNGTYTVTGPAYPSRIVPSVGGSSGTVWIDGQGRIHTDPPRPAGSMYHQVQDVYFDAQGNKLGTISHTHVVDGDCNPGRRQQDLVASIHDDGHGQVSFTQVAQTEPATGLPPGKIMIVNGHHFVMQRDGSWAATEGTGSGTPNNGVGPTFTAGTGTLTNATLTLVPATLR